jgi:hypothetical protein
MIRASVLLILTTLLAEPAVIPASMEGFPFQDETLDYKLNLSAGVPIGKIRTIARHDASRGWNFNLTLEASLPGYPIIDRFNAYAGLNLCSISFDRSSEHGRRKANETVYYDRGKSIAVRTTKNGGGLSEIPVGLCPHDALSFLYYLRRELGQGRVPPNDVVLAGAAYRVNLLYMGEKKLSRNNQQVVVDQINCAIKGPASDVRLEFFFARDAARTPLEVRYPLALGTFTLELVR